MLFKPSPVIKEAFTFESTAQGSLVLERRIKAINVDGVKVDQVDVLFGIIHVTLPNPAVFTTRYNMSRTMLFSELTAIIEKTEKGE